MTIDQNIPNTTILRLKIVCEKRNQTQSKENNINQLMYLGTFFIGLKGFNFQQ